MAKERLFQLGFILLTIGAALPIFSSHFIWACMLFTLGTALIVPIQISERIKTNDFRIKRHRRQQLLGAFLLVITAIFMFCHHFHLRPISGDEWKITLAIAVLFETYSIFRIDALERKNKSNNK